MNTYVRDNQNVLKTPINDSGQIEFTDAAELTIASGVITVIQNFHSVDSEGDAASDDLATITAGADVAAGFVLTLRVQDAARTIVLKNGTGGAANIDIGADVTLDETFKTFSLVFDGTNWRPWSFAAAPTFASLSPLTTRGDLLYGSSGTPTGARLAVGAANTVLGADGTDTAWQLKPLTTRGDLLYGSSGVPTGTRLAAGAANTLLGSDGTDVAWQLKPLTTRGDILYASSGVPTGTRLPVGGSAEVLTSDGTDVAWAAAAAGGKVVQVQSFYYTAQVGSTSSTFATTNVVDTITLADSDNKCLVIASVGGIAKTGATSVQLRISRAISGGATTIIPGTGNWESAAAWTNTTGTNQVGGSTITTLDSPETASEITYTIEFANAQNVSNTYVQIGNGRSSITLIEIEV
jgi:hypothetical protein|tara:strand:- start:16839 stop:18062 length:1224 start_codon:yes stop_codon:yes gene_type:complete